MTTCLHSRATNATCYATRRCGHMVQATWYRPHGTGHLPLYTLPRGVVVVWVNMIVGHVGDEGAERHLLDEEKDEEQHSNKSRFV